MIPLELLSTLLEYEYIPPLNRSLPCALELLPYKLDMTNFPFELYIRLHIVYIDHENMVVKCMVFSVHYISLGK